MCHVSGHLPPSLPRETDSFGISMKLPAVARDFNASAPLGWGNCFGWYPCGAVPLQIAVGCSEVVPKN